MASKGITFILNVIKIGQKINTNTYADTIVICYAYLFFLRKETKLQMSTTLTKSMFAKNLTNDSITSISIIPYCIYLCFS
jgi:hypothetical protein